MLVYSVRKTSLTLSPSSAATKRRNCTGTSTAAWPRPEPDGKAIMPGIVMTGCTRHCGTRARGIMLRLHERVTYWWPDSVQFNGVHVTGNKIGLSKSVIRNLLRLADGLPAFNILGIILIASSQRNQRCGDHLAKTYVIRQIPDLKT